MRGAVLSLLLVGCGGAEVDRFASLDEALRAEGRAGGFPGLVAARVEGGRVVWTGTYGFADYAARRPAETGTPFHVASLSKTVTALLAMQLAEDGVIDLDAPIDDTLGYEVIAQPNAITARMLLTHSSGLVDDFITLGAATSEGDPTTSLAEFASSYLADPEHFDGAPGERHSYTNAGFGVLGAVLEGATNTPLPQLSATRIFGPLAMNDSAWRLADLDVDRVAVPYGGDVDDGLFPQPHEGFDFYPASSWRTSIDDLARYLAAIMNGGEGVLAADATSRLLTVQAPDVDPDQCIGWYYEKIEGVRYLGHTGSASGASAMLFMDPERAVGVALVANSDAFIRGRFGDTEDRDRLYRLASRVLTE